jgi:Gas vesicle protein K
MNRARATKPIARGQLDFSDRLSGDLSSLDEFARELGGRRVESAPAAEVAGMLPRRINANQTTVEKDVAKLVLALVDLVRRLMERQAVRRVNAGSLSEDEVERMGETFLKLERRMEELRTAFGLERQDLDLNLGPIRDLL